MSGIDIITTRNSKEISQSIFFQSIKDKKYKQAAEDNKQYYKNTSESEYSN